MIRRSNAGLAAGALLVSAIAAAAALSTSAAAAEATAAPAPAPAAAPPAWVAASNAHSQVLLDAQAKFNPEFASFFGIAAADENVADLGPKVNERFRAAMAEVQADLRRRLAAERDPQVKQDLAILIQATADNIEGSELNQKYLLPFNDVGQVVFFGQQALLDEQTAAERKPAALKRLEKYLGLAPGSTSIFQLAKDRFTEALGNKALLGPVRTAVDQALENGPTYASGIRDLFKAAGIEAGPALDALDAQVKDYGEWMRANVLPHARDDFRLPPELYANALKQVGIDIAPQLLIERARLEFMETRAAMEALAPQVAKAAGLRETGYREVMRALKAKTLADDKVESHYRGVIGDLEKLIAQNAVVDLPGRPMQMRLGSAAESAAQPAPHFLPAPLIGNTGQQGTFVLPMGNPNLAEGERYDDFNFPAVAWTLAAHEGRPGHELQFTAMVERGVSLARSLFAFNSVNVEGWALYAEAEMVPYEPLEGQLFALQFRLLRAARAVLDPMLNLGLVGRERAGEILREDVGLSRAMAEQELDRYTFKAPGQAGSYFYGYIRLMELRMETEVVLGDKFDRKAFNNFVLDQGLLPPGLLGQAVREEFIPARR